MDSCHFVAGTYEDFPCFAPMISRTNALETGEKHYFSKKPCARCGNFERFTANGCCVVCKKKKIAESIDWNGDPKSIFDQLWDQYRLAQKGFGWCVNNATKTRIWEREFDRCGFCGCNWVLDRVDPENPTLFSLRNDVQPRGMNTRAGCVECREIWTKDVILLSECFTEAF